MRLKNLLRNEGVEPDLTRLDQCFMKDPEVIRLIINSADLKKSDKVLEIGAGTGILTNKLTKIAGEVIAVEKDPRLYNLLSSLIKGNNVRIVIGDIKQTGFFQANKIVSNLPYTLLDWFFKELNEYDFELAVLTIPLKFYKNQISKYENLKIRKIKIVEPNAFYPMPRVKSVVVKVSRT